MIDVSIICIFVIAHFLSDLASNKINSKEPYHSLSYMIVFFCCIILFLDAALALHFTLFAGILHYSTDFIINKIKPHLDKFLYDFLYAIDHITHLITLLYIYSLLK